MIHISEDIKFELDPHITVLSPDFSLLNKLYEGRTVYYGDYHVHSASGGTSDGKTTQEEWLLRMKELGMDFVGLMDHRQVLHMYLDSFDEEYFLCGTEPLIMIEDKDIRFHYLIIVPEKECLVRVLEKFPDVFEFTGGVEGTFKYKSIKQARFFDVVKAVREEGGVVVHAHPKQLMTSTDPADYYFGEGSIIEIIYTIRGDSILNPITIGNYKLWMDMLDKGYKVTNTATNDCHRAPENTSMNVVYSDRKCAKAYLEYLKNGDLNSGYIGIKMSIDENPVGSTVKYSDSKTLYIKIDDAHEQRFDKNEKYRIDVISDRGIAYSSEIKIPFAVALEIQDRRFYRAVVVKEADGEPAAIGNPIWLE